MEVTFKRPACKGKGYMLALQAQPIIVFQISQSVSRSPYHRVTDGSHP